jgi:hypothetical protein
MLRTPLAYLFVTASLGASSVVAQPVPMAERAERLGALFSDLGPAQLRVETAAGTIESGMLGPVRPQTFVLESARGPTTIDYRDVRTVAQEGGHEIQGALWGAGAGALAGGFFGLMVHSYDCTTPLSCNRSENSGGIRGAIVVGAVGALIGYLFGRRQSHWHPIYP